MDLHSSGEPTTRLLGESVWDEFRCLKRSTEVIIKYLDSEEPSRWRIKEISDKHISIKKAHSRIMRCVAEQVTNECRSTREYEEMKYMVKEITSLLVQTRDGRDAAIDRFVIYSTQQPMVNTVEEIEWEEEVTSLPVQLTPSPVVVTTQQTATITTASQAVNIEEAASSKQKEYWDIKEEGTFMNADAYNYGLHVMQLKSDLLLKKIVKQDPMDLGIFARLQAPYDRGKVYIKFL